MNPFDVLGLSHDASPQEVKARWRELAAQHHPDKGGDAEDFHRYQTAYTEAFALASEPKPCANCGGSGKIGVARGFNVTKLMCQECGGTGVMA